MHWEHIVRFQDHANPFLVVASYCENPKCDCNEVRFHLHEISDCGEKVVDPISVSFHVDLETWEEQDPPLRSVRRADWVRQFVVGCSAEFRTNVRLEYDKTKRIARRLADYQIDPEEILTGMLFSYSELMSDGGALSHGGTGYLHRLTYNGNEFLVEDLYCPNPECDCRTMHLQFWRFDEKESDGTKRYELKRMFCGQVTFTGDREVESLQGCSPGLADVLFTDWWNRHAADLRMFEERYREVRKIAQRSLDAADVILDSGSPNDAPLTDFPLLSAEADGTAIEQVAAPKRIGRNDPCPCGSGRKYKKCCAAVADKNLKPRSPR